MLSTSIVSKAYPPPRRFVDVHTCVTFRGAEAGGLQCLVQGDVPITAGGPLAVSSLLKDELHGDRYSCCGFQYLVAWSFD